MSSGIERDIFDDVRPMPDVEASIAAEYEGYDPDFAQGMMESATNIAAVSPIQEGPNGEVRIFLPPLGIELVVRDQGLHLYNPSIGPESYHTLPATNQGRLVMTAIESICTQGF